jgi:hypothetical protein
MDYIRQNFILWTPRLGFMLLLLTFGELVAWYRVASYGALDWLAVIIIYLALAAISLDILARWHSHTWLTAFLTGGAFGIVHSSLVSLALYNDLPVSFVLYATGLQTGMFLLAYSGFRLLYCAEFHERWLYITTPLLGLGWGIWTRWLPAQKGVNLSVLALGETLPYTILALIACALVVYFLPLPPRLERAELMLTPLEWGVAGILLAVVLILRRDGGYIATWGLIAGGIVLGMIFLLLPFARTVYMLPHFALPIQPDRNLLVRWIVMFIPFSLAAWAGYELSNSTSEPLQSKVLVIAVAIFGSIWLPLISVVVSFQAFIELGRQEY